MRVTLVPVAKYRHILRIIAMSGSLHARHGSDEVHGINPMADKENNDDLLYYLYAPNPKCLTLTLTLTLTLNA